MEDKEEGIHSVVELMLARMDSHPEEFAPGGRWVEVMECLEDASPPERSLIKAGYRKIILARAHELAMNELCNGEERRKKQEEAERQAQQEQLKRYAAAQVGASSLAANQLQTGGTTASYPALKQSSAEAIYQQIARNANALSNNTYSNTTYDTALWQEVTPTPNKKWWQF